LLGVLLNSAQIGMFSIRIADKSKESVVVPRIFESYLPNEDFTCKEFEFSLLFKYMHNKSLLPL
jgi:hypothetical protein